MTTHTLDESSALVTGAGGFIGSHLVEHLLEEGRDVHALVEYNRQGSRGWLERIDPAENLEVTLGDVRDEAQVRDLVEDVDMVFHLAALVGIPYSYEAPHAYLQTNTAGTLNILEACRTTGIDRLVHTSTSEVYGSAQYVPIDEEHPLNAQSPYAATKIAADQLVNSYRCSFGLPTVTLRPFNTFGPRQSARAVIPTIITQCLTSDTVELGNLSPTRDFNYVQNTVDAFIQAAGKEDCVGETIQVGSGTEISIGTLAEKIVELSGRDVAIRSVTDRERPEDSEVDRLLADAERARDLLEWKPRVGLEKGLQRTIDWMSDNLDRYRPNTYAV